MEAELQDLDRAAERGAAGRARMRIRRLALIPVVRLGCLLGCLPAFPAALACTLAGLWASDRLLAWLERWETVRVVVLGREMARVDLLQLMHLTGLFERLQWMEARRGLVGLGALLGLTVMGGMIVAGVLVALAVGYNVLAWLLGGLSVEVEER